MCEKEINALALPPLFLSFFCTAVFPVHVERFEESKDIYHGRQEGGERGVVSSTNRKERNSMPPTALTSRSVEITLSLDQNLPGIWKETTRHCSIYLNILHT